MHELDDGIAAGQDGFHAVWVEGGGQVHRSVGPVALRGHIIAARGQSQPGVAEELGVTVGISPRPEQAADLGFDLGSLLK